MHRTQLAYTISQDYLLQQRCMGLIHTRAARATATERRLLDTLQTPTLTAVIAGNPTVVNAVAAAIEDNPGMSVQDAVEEHVPDSDIEFILLAELTFLAD